MVSIIMTSLGFQTWMVNYNLTAHLMAFLISVGQNANTERSTGCGYTLYGKQSAYSYKTFFLRHLILIGIFELPSCETFHMEHDLGLHENEPAGEYIFIGMVSH